MAQSSTEVFRVLAEKFGRPTRMIAIGVLALVLLIPLEMVDGVVRERHRNYRSVVEDIAGSWSGSQLLAGPILVVPYHERVEVSEEYVTPSGERKTTSRWESRQRRAVILPATLDLDGAMMPEMRNRGIYEVRVYTAELVIEASFTGLEQSIRALCAEDRLEGVDWDGAVVAFGLSDPRGVVEVGGFTIDGRPVQARPGTTLDSILDRGLHMPTGPISGDALQIRMPAVIRGSESLRFLPLGETTRASLRSDWPHPSFVGDILPAAREVSDAGFAGEWTIPLLNRSYPQAWAAGRSVDIREIEAGVRLFEPVALYDLVTRSTKYGLLFVVLTFLTLGLIESVANTRLSLVQFLLIGVALALFFLILVALAEHIGFLAAYLLASATVVSINTGYCAAILPKRSMSLVVAVVLTAVYGVLYTILEAEDYALLGGTVLLVAALVVTMYFTRRLHRQAADQPGVELNP